MTSLAAYVRDKRESRGLGVTGLAEIAGLTKSEISAIERGRISLPGADKRRRLAHALGVSHLDLLVAAGEITNEEIASVDKAGVVEREQHEFAQFIIERAHAINWDNVSGYMIDMLKTALNGLVRDQGRTSRRIGVRQDEA